MIWFTRWRQSAVRDFSDAIRPELQALPTPVAIIRGSPVTISLLW